MSDIEESVFKANLVSEEIDEKKVNQRQILVKNIPRLGSLQI